MAIYFTDTKTNLSLTLLLETNINLIPHQKSYLGNIIYALDRAVSENNDVIYLTNNENYEKIVALCKRTINMHAKGSIQVINVESCPQYGKNNLSLRLLNNINFLDNLEVMKTSLCFKEELVLA